MTYLDFFPVPMEGPAAVTAGLIGGMSAVGLAVGFFLAEPRSPAARALAIFFAAMGCAVGTSFPLVVIYEAGGDLPWLLRLPLFDTITIWAAGLWLLRLARTAQPTRQALAWVMGCVCVMWFGALAAAVSAWYFPIERATEFLFCLGRPQGCGQAGFWIFGSAWGMAILAMFGGTMILFNQRIDLAERTRVIAIAGALPFLTGVLNLPLGYNAISLVLGLLIIAIGMIRYYSMQGERAQFLSRFLSPEVEKLVRYRGLDHVVQPKSLEITAVSCDLRGFTRVSQLLASDQVVRLLNEYYDAIGKAVAEFGGTIKDYAGDGVLILVGAPLPADDHAKQGLALAHRLQDVVHEVLRRWAGPEMQLGMGVGVASGRVTVGAIGTTRMEYTAVGPAVNLAARLCAQAQDNEILVDARTAELAGASGLETRGTVAVKGIGDVLHYGAATG